MSRSTTVRTPAAELDLPGDPQVRHSVRGLPLAKFRRKRAAVPMPGPQWRLDSRGHHARLAGDRGALIWRVRSTDLRDRQVPTLRGVPWAVLPLLDIEASNLPLPHNGLVRGGTA